MNSIRTARETMSGYYAWQSRIYDATRWAFLFGRNALVNDLQLRRGETVVEVGCGTGCNFERILGRIGPTGKLVAVDCSTPMINRAHRLIQKRQWRNVFLLDREYGTEPVTGGTADAVLMSYSLSMIPRWQQAIHCAVRELKCGGRLGVVDFCMVRQTPLTSRFCSWMAWNHVALDRPYHEQLSAACESAKCVTRRAFGGLWTFYRFVGRRSALDTNRS